MTGTIEMLAGAVAEVLPSPVGPLAIRSHAQRREDAGAVEKTEARLDVEALSGQDAPDKAFLASILEKARSAGFSKKTELSFEQDAANGQMYVYVRDKRTGEEVLRIPAEYLADAALRKGQVHRVDVRI